MSFFLLSDPCRANFSWNRIFTFFDQSKRGFKFLLKHDWLKKVKFEINGSINLEQFVNKFHSPSLIIFFIAFALRSSGGKQKESLKKSFRSLFL